MEGKISKKIYEQFQTRLLKKNNSLKAYSFISSVPLLCLFHLYTSGGALSFFLSDFNSADSSYSLVQEVLSINLCFSLFCSAAGRRLF